MPEEQRSVSVLHEPGPGTVTARLVIGVGTCDEPVLLAGITHMVEHLAVRAALPIAAPHNAVTTDWVTSFETEAPTTEQALDVLVGMTRAIAGLVDVSDADVDRERKILAGEDRFRYSEQVASIHTVRFGPTGPGRSGAGAAATYSVTAAEVRDWVRRWFVAENAIVTVLGGTAPVERLEVALPSGRATGALPRWTGSLRGVGLQASGLSGIAASVVVPRATAPLLEAVVEHEVFDDVRIGAATSYTVEAHRVDVDLETTAVAVVVNPAEEDAAATTETLVATLRRIAERGPSPATVARIEAARALNTLDPAVRGDYDLWVRAMHRLRGLPEPGPLGADVTAAETTDLRAALQRALRDLIVCVDEDWDVDLEALADRVGLSYAEHTAGRPLAEGGRLGRRTGRTHRDAVLPSWASARVRLHGPMLTLLLRNGEDRVVDLSAAAVIGTRGTVGITIVDAHGALFQVRADDWWRGSRLVDEVRAAAPAHLVREFTT